MSKLSCKLGFHDWIILERRLSSNVFKEMLETRQLTKEFVSIIPKDGYKFQKYVDRKVCIEPSCGMVIDEIQELKDIILLKQDVFHIRLTKAHDIWNKKIGVVPILPVEYEKTEPKIVGRTDPYKDENEDEVE